MSSTQFVEMYHPLIPATATSPVEVALQSVDDHAARGWLLVDPDVAPPAPATPYYTRAELLSQIQGGAAPIGTALRAAFGTLGHDVVLPSGARVVPLPGILKNEWRYNATTFIQDNVTTVGGSQYAVWVNAAGNPVIGKHIPGSDTWQTFDLSTIAGNPLGAPVNGDGHNVYVLAVDSDGYIHVAGDHHVNPLQYVRSTSPGGITAWTAPGMVGTDETGVSYPQFVHRGNELLFIYRQTPLADGSSGDFTVINAYNTTTKTWTRRARPLDGTTGTPKTAPYTNRMAVAADGTLHLFYAWRDVGAGANDPSLGHIKSTDGGVTWTQMNGAAMTLPVTKANHVQIASLTVGNQQGADVDANGIPHAAFLSVKGFGVAVRHIYWTGSAWQVDDVVNQSVEPASLTRNPRAALFCRGTETYVVYTTGQTGGTAGFTGGGGQSVRIRNVAAADRHVDFPLLEANLGQFEVAPDSLALRNRDELTMLVTAVQTEDASVANVDLPKHMRAGGGILTYPLNLLRLSAMLADGPVMNERVWIPAANFKAWEGTPASANRTGFDGWELPDAATSSIVTASRVPDRWQGYNVDIWWVNQAAGAGAIRVRTMLQQLAPGASLDSSPSNYGDATATLTAGGNGVATISRTLTAQPHINYDTDRLAKVVVRRLGGDGADTLAANALILGVMLSPALIP